MAKPKKKTRVSDDLIVETIIQLCTATGEEGTVRPQDVAMELYPEDWQSLTKRIRLTARQLAEAGHIVIVRKGGAVDPNDFKGVYRLRIALSFLQTSATIAPDDPEIS